MPTSHKWPVDLLKYQNEAFHVLDEFKEAALVPCFLRNAQADDNHVDGDGLRHSTTSELEEI